MRVKTLTEVEQGQTLRWGDGTLKPTAEQAQFIFDIAGQPEKQTYINDAVRRECALYFSGSRTAPILFDFTALGTAQLYTLDAFEQLCRNTFGR